jgi:hypothetical protein
MTVWTLLRFRLHKIVYYFRHDKVNQTKNRAPFTGFYPTSLSFYLKRTTEGDSVILYLERFNVPLLSRRIDNSIA